MIFHIDHTVFCKFTMVCTSHPNKNLMKKPLFKPAALFDLTSIWNNLKNKFSLDQSTGAVEYTDCISAEG